MSARTNGRMLSWQIHNRRIEEMFGHWEVKMPEQEDLLPVSFNPSWAEGSIDADVLDANYDPDDPQVLQQCTLPAQTTVADESYSLQFGPMLSTTQIPAADMMNQDRYNAFIAPLGDSATLQPLQILEAHIVNGWLPIEFDDDAPEKSILDRNLPPTKLTLQSIAKAREEYCTKLAVSFDDYQFWDMKVATMMWSAASATNPKLDDPDLAPRITRTLRRNVLHLCNATVQRSLALLAQTHRQVDAAFIAAQQPRVDHIERYNLQPQLLKLLSFVKLLYDASWCSFQAYYYNHPRNQDPLLSNDARYAYTLLDQLYNNTPKVTLQYGDPGTKRQVEALLDRPAIEVFQDTAERDHQETLQYGTWRTVNTSDIHSIVFHPTAWMAPFIQLGVTINWAHYADNNFFARQLHEIEHKIEQDYNRIRWAGNENDTNEPSLDTHGSSKRKRSVTGQPSTIQAYNDYNQDYMRWLMGRLRKADVPISYDKFTAAWWTGRRVPYTPVTDLTQDYDHITYRQVRKFLTLLLHDLEHLQAWLFGHGGTSQLETIMIQAAYYLYRSYKQLKHIRNQVKNQPIEQFDETQFRQAYNLIADDFLGVRVDDLKEVTATRFRGRFDGPSTSRAEEEQIDKAYLQHLRRKHFRVTADSAVSFKTGLQRRCSAEIVNGTYATDSSAAPDVAFVALNEAYHRYSWLEVYDKLVKAVCSELLQTGQAPASNLAPLDRLRLEMDMRTLFDFFIVHTAATNEQLAALVELIPTLVQYTQNNQFDWWSNDYEGIRYIGDNVAMDCLLLLKYRRMLLDTSTDSTHLDVLKTLLRRLKNTEQRTTAVKYLAAHVCSAFRTFTKALQPYTAQVIALALRPVELSVARIQQLQQWVNDIMTAKRRLTGQQAQLIHLHVRLMTRSETSLREALGYHSSVPQLNAWPAIGDPSWNSAAMLIRGNVSIQDMTAFPLETGSMHVQRQEIGLTYAARAVFPAPPVGYAYSCALTDPEDLDVVFVLPRIRCTETRDQQQYKLTGKLADAEYTVKQLMLHETEYRKDGSHTTYTASQVLDELETTGNTSSANNWVQASASYVALLRAGDTLIVNRPYVAIVVYRFSNGSKRWHPRIDFRIARGNAPHHAIEWDLLETAKRNSNAWRSMRHLPEFLQLLWLQQAHPQLAQAVLSPAQRWQVLDPLQTTQLFPFVDLTLPPSMHESMRHRRFIDGLFLRTEDHTEWQLRSDLTTAYNLRVSFRQLREMVVQSKHKATKQYIVSSEPVWVEQEFMDSSSESDNAELEENIRKAVQPGHEARAVALSLSWPDFVVKDDDAELQLDVQSGQRARSRFIKCYITHQLMLQRDDDPNTRKFLMILTWVRIAAEDIGVSSTAPRLLVWVPRGLQYRLMNKSYQNRSYDARLYEELAKRARAAFNNSAELPEPSATHLFLDSDNKRFAAERLALRQRGVIELDTVTARENQIDADRDEFTYTEDEVTAVALEARKQEYARHKRGRRREDDMQKRERTRRELQARLWEQERDSRRQTRALLREQTAQNPEQTTPITSESDDDSVNPFAGPAPFDEVKFDDAGNSADEKEEAEDEQDERDEIPYLAQNVDDDMATDGTEAQIDNLAMTLAEEMWPPTTVDKFPSILHNFYYTIQKQHALQLLRANPFEASTAESSDDDEYQDPTHFDKDARKQVEALQAELLQLAAAQGDVQAQRGFLLNLQDQWRQQRDEEDEAEMLALQAAYESETNVASSSSSSSSDDASDSDDDSATTQQIT